MIAALQESRIISGFASKVCKDFSRLTQDDADAVVAEATLELFTAVQGGTPVTNVSGWLYTTSKRIAMRWDERRRNERPFADGEDDCIENPWLDPLAQRFVEEEREQLRAEALKVARGLLPQLGTGSVVEVMTVIFEAVEKGLDITDHEVADILGKDYDSVREWRRRGFDRLNDRARKMGVVRPTFNFTKLVDDENEDEDQTDEDQTDADRQADLRPAYRDKD